MKNREEKNGGGVGTKGEGVGTLAYDSFPFVYSDRTGKQGSMRGAAPQPLQPSHHPSPSGLPSAARRHSTAGSLSCSMSTSSMLATIRRSLSRYSFIQVDTHTNLDLGSVVPIHARLQPLESEHGQ